MGQHAIGPVTPLTSRRLLARLARVQRDGRLPSVVAGLVRDGELVWSGGYGDVPGDPVDLQYRIGSITKTVTAVLVLQLVDEGRLGLDDPVRAVLGEVGHADRTVRQLLAHDSGVQAEPHGPWWERSEGVGFDELVAANDGSARAFDPQERFHYSNLGYALLGEVVARLHGRTWWEAAHDRVLGPLGMTRTTYEPQQPHAEGFSVHPYAGTLTREPAHDAGAMAPAGQLWSTVGDLATWGSFLLDGHPDVLSPRRLDQMATPRSGVAATGLASVAGLGLQLLAGGSGTVVGHTGSMPGFLAS
jgi:CubicO group peptidase (beta-lactamase class C family)